MEEGDEKVGEKVSTVVHRCTTMIHRSMPHYWYVARLIDNKLDEPSTKSETKSSIAKGSCAEKEQQDEKKSSVRRKRRKRELIAIDVFASIIEL